MERKVIFIIILEEWASWSSCRISRTSWSECWSGPKRLTRWWWITCCRRRTYFANWTSWRRATMHGHGQHMTCQTRNQQQRSFVQSSHRRRISKSLRKSSKRRVRQTGKFWLRWRRRRRVRRRNKRRNNDGFICLKLENCWDLYICNLNLD